MGKDTTIAVVVRDNTPSGISTIRNSFKALDKDVEETQRKLDALNETKAEIKTNMKPLQKELKETQKAVRKDRRGGRPPKSHRRAAEL